MTEQRSGLRFDIYERVHLADGTVGIRELDEVELVPHIHVFSEGEQAVLKGNLYLTGVYQGEVGEESRTLEHFIPVEITLPLNRIQDLNEVSVQIDQFDVDLLSARSLNITGVLTLEGIEMLYAEEDEGRSPVEETVLLQDADAETEDRAKKKAAEPEPVQTIAEVEESDTYTEVIAQPNEENELEQIFDSSDSQPNDAPEPSDSFSSSQNSPVAEGSTAAADSVIAEQQEMKIGFGSKSENDNAFHLKSLIHRGDLNGAKNTDAPSNELQGVRSADALEWKRLFKGVDSEARPFRQLRMHIVSRDDSLDTIASRYKVIAKEILLHNRMENDQELAEGKVVFIPTAR